MKNLFVSFSGGETSAYMAQWLWKNKQDEFNMEFVFANTGQENEETLEFVEKCSKYFGFPVTWVEADVQFNERSSSKAKIVDFQTADREGIPFENVIMKYGIPNQAFPHCTRETKLNPMKDYIKFELGWEDYYTAIGIRWDESGRINKNARELKIIYPLISPKYIPMTKPKINFWWSQQPFRLNLKGYQGNCKWCWKKAREKLYTIANETPEAFDFPKRMEKKYGYYIPEGRRNEGEEFNLPFTFFRENKSAVDIIREAILYKRGIIDDSQNFNFQISLFENTDLVGGDSCEVFSDCGNENVSI